MIAGGTGMRKDGGHYSGNLRVRKHRIEIDVAVEDNEDGARGGCTSRRGRPCAGREKIVARVEDVVAQLAIKLPYRSG